MAAEDFGRIITAMITPFTSTSAVDLTGVGELAGWLTRPGHNDAIVVNGTTGESPTTSDREKSDIIKAALGGVPAGVKIIAGVGTNDTEHSVRLARQAAAAGAHALLVVSPYYSKPSQDGLIAHFRRIADSTPLPVMLYDIPVRTGVAIEPATMIKLAEHPQIRAVKDAKSDLVASSWVLRESDLVLYSGEDALNLPLAAIGASGVVSVIGHLVADRIRDMLAEQRSGDHEAAVAQHRALLPVAQAIFRAQGVVTVKAALNRLGRPAGPVRSPLIELDANERDLIITELTRAEALKQDVLA